MIMLLELLRCRVTDAFRLQGSLEREVKGLEDKVSAIQQVLGDLKVQLYAKFGNNINLEPDES